MKSHRLNNWDTIRRAQADIASFGTHMQSVRTTKQDIVLWIISYGILFFIFALLWIAQ